MFEPPSVLEKSASEPTAVFVIASAVSGHVIKQEHQEPHGGVSRGISVIIERPSANCRVVIGGAVSGHFITVERAITKGSVTAGVNIF